MPPKNPFKVLGLDADIVKGLSDEQIQKLIKNQYRTLQLIYHPDRGGDEKRSQEINEAYSLVNSDADAEIFQHYKRQFLRRTPFRKQILELEGQLFVEAEKRDLLSQIFTNYLASFTGELDQTVFNIGPCTLEMLDYELIHKIPPHTDFSNKKDKEKVFYNLIVGKNGDLIKKKRKKRKALPDKKLIGTVDDKTCTELGGKMNVLRLAQRIHTYESEKLKRKKLSSSGYVPSPIMEFQNHMSPESFQEIMLRLTPQITKGSLLFSLNSSANGPFFSLDGLVTRIQKNS